jgi:hypothetical protein
MMMQAGEGVGDNGVEVGKLVSVTEASVGLGVDVRTTIVVVIKVWVGAWTVVEQPTSPTVRNKSTTAYNTGPPRDVIRFL